jgi:hypothetical protein
LIVADTTNGETRIGQVRHNDFGSSSPFDRLVPADDAGPTALTDAILRLDLDAVIVDHADAW